MRNLLTFLWRNHFVILFIMLEVFSVVMIVNHSHYQRAHIIKSSSQVTGSINQTFRSIFDYFSLKKVNMQLANENARLRTLLFDSVPEQSITTLIIKDTAYGQVYEYLPAKIVSNSINKRNNFILINQGTANGIKKDMAVIGPQGVVGIVKEVSRNFSAVLPVLHSQSRISAKIKKIDQLGTVTWDGINYRHGQITDVPTHAVVAVGDTVITSGFSLIFPEGIMIGTISDIEMDENDNFYSLRIDFSSDYNSISWVYVVKNFHREELKRLEVLTFEEGQEP
jgi:rod shape-determining protein MreC